MSKEDLMQWASAGFYKSFRRNKVEALFEAKRNAVHLQWDECASLASTYDAVALRATQMSGWLAGGKLRLWLISACISFLLEFTIGGVWYLAPLVIMLLVAFRDRWVCRSRAEAYSALARVLDARDQETTEGFTGSKLT